MSNLGEVKYLESGNLKIVPVYKGLSIDKFLVVGGETTVEFKLLYEAENFILDKKEFRAGRIVFGSAAEFRSY